MKKTLSVLAAAGVLAAATIAAPTAADARGGRLAAGLIFGGIAAGLAGAAIASQAPYYYGPPAYAYYPPPGPYSYSCFQTQRVWGRYGWHYVRVNVC